VETAVVMTLSRLGLILLPFSALQRLVERGRATSAPKDRALPERVSWAIAVLSSRVPGRNTCLVQALTADSMLRRGGYQPTLRIGVAGKDAGGTIKAHAWLECEGRVVTGALEDLSSYSVLR
jgi:hypothetical protein